MQSSEDPNPQPLQHTPLRFRTPQRPRTRSFVEDDLAGRRPRGRRPGKQRSGPALHHGSFAQRDGAQAAANLVGAGAAGLAAAQAFRSQLPQDAAEHMRLNVMPRPGPQIIGRPDNVERLDPGRGGQVERGAAQAIEETSLRVPGRPGRRSSSPRRGQRHERRHAASARHAALRQQHFRQPRNRASSQSGLKT